MRETDHYMLVRSRSTARCAMSLPGRGENGSNGVGFSLSCAGPIFLFAFLNGKQSYQK